jgi:hypothetical protein
MGALSCPLITKYMGSHCTARVWSVDEKRDSNKYVQRDQEGEADEVSFEGLDARLGSFVAKEGVSFEV